MVWTKYHTITLILALTISYPIWFYILYVLLKNANVDRLVWFLYIIYLPTQIIGAIIVRIAEGKGDDK